MSENSTSGSIHSQNVIACVWDFDKTLIPGYMQQPLFDAYSMDGQKFWNEVNQLPELYAKRGISVSKDTVYLNHLLNHVKNGALKGLNNAKLTELGKLLPFYPGLPDLFKRLQEFVLAEPSFQTFDLKLEHYIISTGLAAMIRGSQIAPYTEGIYGCEFVENPFPPGFINQHDLIADHDAEISQIGVMVDNTIKTRFIFEINKGSNKHPDIDVNAKVPQVDRRIPFKNMIYIADGPSDVPAFSVVKDQGGLAYAVYDPNNEAEFAQNDRLLQSQRIHAYGPANYTEGSQTDMWLKMHIKKMCQRIVAERMQTLQNRIQKPPGHIHEKDKENHSPDTKKVVSMEQTDLLESQHD